MYHQDHRGKSRCTCGTVSKETTQQSWSYLIISYWTTATNGFHLNINQLKIVCCFNSEVAIILKKQTKTTSLIMNYFFPFHWRVVLNFNAYGYWRVNIRFYYEQDTFICTAVEFVDVHTGPPAVANCAHCYRLDLHFLLLRLNALHLHCDKLRTDPLPLVLSTIAMVTRLTFWETAAT